MGLALAAKYVLRELRAVNWLVIHWIGSNKFFPSVHRFLMHTS